MENLVGKKMKGFSFREKNCLRDRLEMHGFRGEVGEIVKVHPNFVDVYFGTFKTFSYPLPEVLEHIIQDEPIVPELGEGVEMHVSNGGVDWFNIKIIGKYKGKYISNVFATFEYARPIQPKKLTMAELEELVGGKFEIVK